MGSTIRVKFGIEPLDLGLPEGVPRSSTIVLAGPGGTGKSVITTHIARNFMERGEHVVYLTLDDSPKAVLETFDSFGWDHSKYVSNGKLLIIDGFSFRLKGLRRWGPVPGVVREVTIDDLSKVLYSINEVLDRFSIEGEGVLIVDSLNELMFRFDLTQILDFVRTLRAAVSKVRGVIVLITLHTSTDSLKELAAHLEYLVDGIIVTRIEPELQGIGIPLKQLMVKKMRGAPTNPLWIPYVVSSNGIKGVDPSKLSALIKSKLKQALLATKEGEGGSE